MAAHAGEKAWRTGTFKCQVCNAEVRVRKGRTIPKCPNGHATFDERVGELRGEKPLRGHPRRKTSAGGKRRSSSRSHSITKSSRKARSSSRARSKSRGVLLADHGEGAHAPRDEPRTES